MTTAVWPLRTAMTMAEARVFPTVSRWLGKGVAGRAG